MWAQKKEKLSQSREVTETKKLWEVCNLRKSYNQIRKYNGNSDNDCPPRVSAVVKEEIMGHQS